MMLAISGESRDMREQAMRSGLMPLVVDGLRKVEQGVATLEELRRVVPLDQIRAVGQEEQLAQKNKEEETLLA
jgi:hypothetical protein